MRSSGALIGLDIGTAGARAVAIDAEGLFLAGGAANYPLSIPRPGWAEQDPAHWWAASVAAIRQVVGQIRQPVLGLGLTGQMHGSVFLDGQDRVIRPALLWNDQRTAVQCEAITEAVGADRLLQITGNPALTGFQAPKVLWLRDEEPLAYTRVEHVLLPKDYVRLRLTGEYATDASDASGTLLLNLERRDWSDELLGALHLPSAWFPRVHEGPDQTGAVTAAAAADTGLAAGIPVAAGGGDNAAAAVGLGVVETGTVSVSIGTSGVIFADVGTQALTGNRLHSFCHAVPGRYHLMGVTLSAGGSLRWWRDNMLPELDFDELAALALESPAGAEGLLYLPYLTGERSPHLDPFARGAFIGLTPRHSRAHLTRAIMEGVSYSLMDCLDLVRNHGLAISEVRLTGGGARSGLWRQLQADILGLPVLRPVVDEGPAYGAALLAGVTAGVFTDTYEACSSVRLSPEVVQPDPGRMDRYDRYHSAYVTAYPTVAPLMHCLTRLTTGRLG